MNLNLWGRRGLFCAAFFLAATPVQADRLCATRLNPETLLGCLQINPGERWSILWNHSVEGFLVEDVYENRDGLMVLVRSHQPDFAAGLGHIPGRGRQVSDGQGGYWIEDIDEPVPGNSYVLRPGSAQVGHRVQTDKDEIALSALAPRERVRLTLAPED